MSEPRFVPDHDTLASFDLGTYRRAVSTGSHKASEWFNRGLIWCYAFNHEAAVSCFEQAGAEDEDFAMAHWGVAYALGPNYNKPWTSFGRREKKSVLKRTSDAVNAARERASSASPVEQALIDALQYRYQNTSIDDNQTVWNQDYALAMRKVYKQYSDDVDVAALYADAMMNLTPWNLWDIQTGQPAAGACTPEIEQVLKDAFSTDAGLSHPGLLHLHIHFWELSPNPDAALPIASRLRGLVPDAGHLNHMPSHLDLLCGNYHTAVQANSKAVEADEKFLDMVGPRNFYTLYRLHDYHFLIYSAMFSAQYKIALRAVEGLEASLPEELLRIKSPPMADWLESFLSTRVHVMIRFGQWQDIIDMKLPEDSKLYACTNAITFYGKGIAYAAIGDLKQAKSAQSQFRVAKAEVPESRSLFNNSFADILGVAEAMLNGEIEYRQQNYDKAFKHLQSAIELDDDLPFDEPWGWMQPTRHAYGALLLEQGHVEKAAAVYRADLGLDNSLPRALRHPKNIWSLHGYHECMTRLGRLDDARAVAHQLREAQKIADVPVASSCFCRLHTTRAAEPSRGPHSQDSSRRGQPGNMMSKLS